MWRAQCATVHVASLPAFVYHSLQSNTSLELQALNRAGSPLDDFGEAETIYYEIHYSDGTRSGTQDLAMEDGGRATLPLFDPATQRTLLTSTGQGPRSTVAATITQSCAQHMTDAATAVVVLLPRVWASTAKFTSTVSSLTAPFSAKVGIGAIWSHVSAEDPLILTLKPLMLPDYGVSFYPPRYLQFFHDHRINGVHQNATTGASNVGTLTITANHQFSFPSIPTKFAIVIDGVVTGVVDDTYRLGGMIQFVCQRSAVVLLVYYRSRQ